MTDFLYDSGVTLENAIGAGSGIAKLDAYLEFTLGRKMGNVPTKNIAELRDWANYIAQSTGAGQQNSRREVFAQIENLKARYQVASDAIKGQININLGAQQKTREILNMNYASRQIEPFKLPFAPYAAGCENIYQTPDGFVKPEWRNTSLLIRHIAQLEDDYSKLTTTLESGAKEYERELTKANRLLATAQKNDLDTYLKEVDPLARFLQETLKEVDAAVGGFGVPADTSTAAEEGAKAMIEYTKSTFGIISLSEDQRIAVQPPDALMDLTGYDGLGTDASRLIQRIYSALETQTSEGVPRLDKLKLEPDSFMLQTIMRDGEYNPESQIIKDLNYMNIAIQANINPPCTLR